MDLREKSCEEESDSGSYQIVCFGINGFESSGSATKGTVYKLVETC
jgi:hypothetical protein